MMAGFEVVVRPVVFPDIRPAPARSLPPADDPKKGICVITGGGSFPVQLSFSTSVSTSKSKPVETERRVDETRNHQQNDDGTINKDNFVDTRNANRIKMRRQEGDPVPSIDNVTGLPRPSRLGYEEVSYYKRVEPSANVEILRRDIIETNDDALGAGT